MSRPVRYLLPRPRGVVHALCGGTDDARRRLVFDLLRGGCDRPLQLAELAGALGTDAQQLGALLFRLQREEWVNAEVAPLALPADAFGAALPPLLGALAADGRALLCTENGLVFASTGFERNVACEIAAVLPQALPLLERVARLGHADPDTAPARAWTLGDADQARGLCLVPLAWDGRRFLLVLGREPRLLCDAFVLLAALLVRRYPAAPGTRVH